MKAAIAAAELTSNLSRKLVHVGDPKSDLSLNVVVGRLGGKVEKGGGGVVTKFYFKILIQCIKGYSFSFPHGTARSRSAPIG
jgi:hypothetical protein